MVSKSENYLLQRKMIEGEGIAVLASDSVFHLGTASCHLPASEKYLVSQNTFLEFSCWEVKKLTRNIKLRFVDECH